MAITRVLNLGGLNIYLNPFLKKDGELIRAVNVESIPYGAKSRRPGYVSFLNNPDNSTVNTLWSWNSNLYRASGSVISYSLGGTGNWTTAGNGTIANGNHVGYSVLGTVMIVGDGVNPTRHTTDGTSFTNTTLAPVATEFIQYQNRIYAAGTASTLFYSTTNDATNWNLSGTSDSNSLQIPGEGTLTTVFKAFDRVVTVKSVGEMHRWDGYSLVDMSTESGLSSAYSLTQKEDYAFYMNRDGLLGYDGVDPKIISNPIQGQIYNNYGGGISGTMFPKIPAVMNGFNYYATIGTVTDDYTRETIPNAILKYNLQHNEYLNYSFANTPTAYLSYVDVNGVRQLIFGDASGQCYRTDGTSFTDNGVAISSVQEYSLHLGFPELDKKWVWFTGFFNPGCEANVEISCADYFDKDNMNWINLGDAISGVVEYRFPIESRSKFLFVKITDSSKTAKLTCYGFAIDADPIKKD